MKKINSQILNYSFLFFAFFPIIPNSIKGLPVILLLLVGLYLRQKEKINWNLFLINSSIFFLYIISFIYTQNISYGFKKIETALPFIIIPLVFFVLMPKLNISTQLKNRFSLIFILSSLIFSLIVLLFIVIDNTTVYYKDFYTNKFRIIVEDIPLIGQHPIYASLYLGISLILIFYLIKQNHLIQNKSKTALLFIPGFFNILLLIMLSSRGVILSLIFLIIIYLFKIIIRERKIKQAIIIFCLISTSVIVLFVTNRRMAEMINFETYSSLNSNYSNSFRINIYKCSLNLLEKSIFLGYGVGDAQDELDSCYISKNQLLLLEEKYNSHNQYLDFSIKLGLVGLFAFILLLITNYLHAKSSKNELLMFLIIFYSLNFLTENILVRQSGLILFVFLLHFFYSKKVVNNSIYNASTNSGHCFD